MMHCKLEKEGIRGRKILYHEARIRFQSSRGAAGCWLPPNLTKGVKSTLYLLSRDGIYRIYFRQVKICVYCRPMPIKLL